MNQKVFFLKQMKEYIEENGFILVFREASIQFMQSTGMSMNELKDIILGLNESDLFDGPEEDRDERYSQWTVAEFAPKWRNEYLYLKISIRNDNHRCKCLSVKIYTDRRS